MSKNRSINSYSKDKVKENAAFTCQICETRREKKFLEVHHINFDPKDNRACNLMVLCGFYTDNRCHKKLHEDVGVPDKCNIFLGGEREKEKNIEPIIKDEVDYQQGSVEMQVNDYAEMPYRNWLKAKIISSPDKRYLKKEAIYSGAEVNEISPTTTRKYLMKMVSEAGELEDYKDVNDKKKYIKFKRGKQN